jgi:hypothetical protein
VLTTSFTVVLLAHTNATGLAFGCRLSYSGGENPTSPELFALRVFSSWGPKRGFGVSPPRTPRCLKSVDTKAQRSDQDRPTNSRQQRRRSWPAAVGSLRSFSELPPKDADANDAELIWFAFACRLRLHTIEPTNPKLTRSTERTWTQHNTAPYTITPGKRVGASEGP